MQAFSKAFDKIAGAIMSFAAKARLHCIGVELGREVRMHGSPIVTRVAGSEILIGDRTVLCSHSKDTALGINHPVVLRALAPNARIVIGRDVGISGGSICAATEITIGDETLLGANVTITDTDFHPVNSRARRHDRNGVASAPVSIGKNVFIGAGVIVLKGVSIGENSVIGAGSVVSGSIPANTIAAGNPCKAIRPLFADTETGKDR